MHQRCEFLLNLIGERLQLRAVRKLQLLVVRKIQLQFYQRSEMQQAFAQRRQLRGYRSAQLTQRQIFLRLALRCNEVSDGLRLRQVHLAVEERSAGELAGFSSLATCVDEPSQKLLLDIETAVTSYLHSVLTRKRTRRAKYRTEHLVQHLSVPLNTAEMHRSALGISQGRTSAEKPIDDGYTPLPGHTDDSDSADTVGSTDGTDSMHVFQIFLQRYNKKLRYASFYNNRTFFLPFCLHISKILCNFAPDLEINIINSIKNQTLCVQHSIAFVQ